jgi:hypothetical protein
MKKEELLYDYYKDTYELIKENIKDRNRFFVILFIVMTIQFLLAVSPDSVVSIVVTIIKNTYDIDISNQITIIQNVLWLVLLYFTMRYYQTAVYIERQYNFIHDLEARISELFQTKFDRESENYLNYYPKMNDVIDLIYKWIIPVIYCIIISIKIFIEAPNMLFGFQIIFDSVIFTVQKDNG